MGLARSLRTLAGVYGAILLRTEGWSSLRLRLLSSSLRTAGVTPIAPMNELKGGKMPPVEFCSFL